MNWPLMLNNISWQDSDAVRRFLRDPADPLTVPRLTQGDQVAAFESEFAAWLGVKYAVMVNSGASANLITIAAMQYPKGAEIIVPTITWVSDIAAVLHAGHQPVFVDIDPRTLGMDMGEVFKKITADTKAVFVTHVLGFNAINEDTRDRLHAMHIDLIEDCCEATGATMLARKLGSIGVASNFSFYYAHHMSTIEGGMVCTDDPLLFDRLRMMRSHGLVRESRFAWYEKAWYENQYADLDPNFIFAYAAWNVRSTEINAVIGRSQLKRLDANNAKRTENLMLWLAHLDPERYVTDYRVGGSSNYALPLVLKEPDYDLMLKVLTCLEDSGIEYRRGTAGGGNQLRQPYLRRLFHRDYEKHPQAEHVHFYGLYIGNYPELETERIEELCAKLNALGSAQTMDEACSTQTPKPLRQI